MERRAARNCGKPKRARRWKRRIQPREASGTEPEPCRVRSGWREGGRPRGMRICSTRPGLSAGRACPLSESACGAGDVTVCAYPRWEPSAVTPRARIWAGGAGQPASLPQTDTNRSRHTPNESRRVAWRRDDGRCGFVAPDGQRCGERAFLEYHHLDAYALGGPSTPDNIALRCRRHNQYEAERVFGPRHGGS